LQINLKSSLFRIIIGGENGKGLILNF